MVYDILSLLEGVMIKSILKKMNDSLKAVAPISLIVLLLASTPLVELNLAEIITFIVCSLFLVFGIGLFNLGADLSMTPMGEQVGYGLTKSRNVTLLLVISLIMGIFITIAEPDLSVLAAQLSSAINGTTLMVVVAVGVGIMLLLAVLRIVLKIELTNIIMFGYLLVFALCAVLIESGHGSFLAVSFDSGGVTTGAITVPFIMALGVGIATSIGGRHANENSFGLIAICSIGPVIAVLALSLFANHSVDYVLPNYELELNSIGSILGKNVLSVFLSIFLMSAFFALIQAFILKLPKERLTPMIIGLGYTFAGVVIFLTAVEIGFMPIGFKIGQVLAQKGDGYIIGFGFIIGLVVVLAEPAIHVLNRQVEDLTEGTVSRKAMLTALSIGVGVSICLSIVRVIFNFSILYYLIPGYLISLILSFFVPKMYTAIAFDSGGVASGPLTSSFILPMVIGVASISGDPTNVLSSAFGVVAMVAMTPLISIQVLGFRAIVVKKVSDRMAMRRILAEDDEQIINFM